MTDAEVTAMIEPILTRSLITSGLIKVSVLSGEDHDGDPALLVDLFFRGGDHGVDTTALISAMVDVRDALEARGERRFPYMTPHIPDPERDLAA